MGAAPPPAALAQYVEERIDACTLIASADQERQLRALAAVAGGIVDALEVEIGVRARAPFRVYLLGPDAANDPLTAAMDRAAPPWAAGYMRPAERVGAVRVAQASRYPYGTIESVFAHEVAHLLIHDAVPRGVPRWFNEGVATRAGRRWSLEDAWVQAAAVLTSALPSMSELEAGFHGAEPQARMAYVASASFVGWAESRYGENFVREVLAAARSVGFEEAWRRAALTPLSVSESQWRSATLLRYRWIPVILTASGLLWALLGFLTFVGGVRKKLQARAQRARWAEEEAAMDAALTDSPDDELESRRGKDSS